MVARAGGTSGNLTVNVASACASFIMTNYVGTLTMNSTLTLTSTCTLVSGMGVAGTAGTLILNGAATLTSGGKVLTCALTLANAIVFTLADSWSVNGLVTFAAGASNVTVNGVGKTLTCTGGLHQISTGGLNGTAKVVLGGGTWDCSGTIGIDVDLAGNVTASGGLTWSAAKTLAYVSGTVTTTGSTITLLTGCTLNTAGVTWNNVSLPGTSASYTNSSTLAWSGTLTLGTNTAVTVTGAGQLNGTGAVAFGGSVATVTLNNTGGLVTTGTMTLLNAAQTFAGSAGWSVGTLTTATLTASRIHTLTFGNTYAVTTALGNVGTSSTIRQSIISSSAGNKVVFNLSPGASNTLTFCDPTDVDSSAGATVLSVGGTITTSLNWSGSTTAGAVGGARTVAVQVIGQEGVRVY